MGVLNQIEQMKNQGISEEEISRRLRQNGISPREIVDGFNQLEVKKTVSKNSEMMSAPQFEDENYDSMQENEMQPSVMENAPEPSEKKYYQPKSQEVSEKPMKNYYTPSPKEESQAEIQPQEYYQGQGYDTSGEGYNTDTIIEISEQIFAERSQEIQKQIKSLAEFSALAQIRISETAERLKRIESVIDKLQISILDKVGSYGQNLDAVRKEMSMMQDSFGKALNPILDKKSEKIIQPEKVAEKNISKKRK